MATILKLKVAKRRFFEKVSLERCCTVVAIGSTLMIDSQVHLSVYNYHRVYDGGTWRSILTVSHHDGFDHEVLLNSSTPQSSLIFVQNVTHEFGTVDLSS